MHWELDDRFSTGIKCLRQIRHTFQKNTVKTIILLIDLLWFCSNLFQVSSGFTILRCLLNNFFMELNSPALCVLQLVPELRQNFMQNLHWILEKKKSYIKSLKAQWWRIGCVKSAGHSADILRQGKTPNTWRYGKIVLLNCVFYLHELSHSWLGAIIRLSSSLHRQGKWYT